MTAVLLNVVSGANQTWKTAHVLTILTSPKLYLFHVNLDTCTYVLDTYVNICLIHTYAIDTSVSGFSNLLLLIIIRNVVAKLHIILQNK